MVENRRKSTVGYSQDGKTCFSFVGMTVAGWVFLIIPTFEVGFFFHPILVSILMLCCGLLLLTPLPWAHWLMQSAVGSFVEGWTGLFLGMLAFSTLLFLLIPILYKERENKFQSFPKQEGLGESKHNNTNHVSFCKVAIFSLFFLLASVVVWTKAEAPNFFHEWRGTTLLVILGIAHFLFALWLDRHFTPKSVRA